jgi:hypothetical protein
MCLWYAWKDLDFSDFRDFSVKSTNTKLAHLGLKIFLL